MCLARSSFCSDRSTAITGDAPIANAPSTALSPTPPHPITATRSPDLTPAPPVYAGPARLDPARPLMAEHRGTARGRRAVDRVEVAVTYAAGVDPHEHLVAARRRQLDVAHVDRLSGVGKDRRGDSHPASFAAWGACSRRSSSIGMWQRMKWPGSSSARGGCSCSQMAPILRGQRVWKTQPVGGLTALGTSPSSRMRCSSRTSRLGAAERSASVYG